MDAPFQPFDPHGPQPPGRRIGTIELRFILPNLITVLAICAGLTGIRFAFEGRIAESVGLVLIAAFLDGIDGRLARAMKAQSKFGAQMDSLADIVNFGVAPAMVLYASILDQARSLGWIAALVYVVACGLRLARFNVMNDYFVGVPAPFGAFLVMLPLYINFLGLELGVGLALVAALYTVVIALLMISQIPIFSGKSAFARVPGDVILPSLLLATVYVALLLTFTWETLTVSALAYFLSMPFGISAFKKRVAQERQQIAEMGVKEEE